MRHIKTLVFLYISILVGWCTQAQVADSVDVLDYDVALDLSEGRPFGGDATLTLRLTAPCSRLELSLWGSVDSVWVNGVEDGQWTVSTGQNTLLTVPTSQFTAGDTLTVRVCYRGNGLVESYGWGGFHFDSDMSYNLGVGFDTDPHVLGRAWMPCRDNFHDKATYTLRVRAKKGWSAECSGWLQSRTLETDSTEHSVWRLDWQVPTYLVSISQSAWKCVNGSVAGVYNTYPLTLNYLRGDSTNVRQAFAELGSVVPMFERCLGPYRWGRIGYIATAKGSMEHVNNIALSKEFMTSLSEQAQMTIAHELGHAWFGNLVTCRTEADMWFNEGGASFTSELAMEANKGREAAVKYYQTDLESVVREAFRADGGYSPLSPMPHEYTYGTTTYNKGSLVWHSLRGYLGEEVFYGAMQRLFSDKAFGTVDATEVRDSLSAYSGVDLTDFFNFHVFNGGFVDYHVRPDYQGCMGNEVGLFVRQQGVGTTATVRSSRLPVTFFSFEGDTAKRVIAFDGTEGYNVVSLPFEPNYFVVDYDCDLSDAATLAVFKAGNSIANKTAHVKLNNTPPQDEEIVVEHHWGQPWDVDTLTGLQRTAKRYWIVRGRRYNYDGLQLQLHFVRDGYTGGNSSYLDRGFVSNAASLDSVVVLYRNGYGEPWQSVSHRRIGDNNEGYFLVDNMRSGEYTLAVVDTALLSVDGDWRMADGGRLTLFPNPMHRGEPLTIDLSSFTSHLSPFTVRIFDAAGRQVWQKKGCHSGRQIKPRLASGTYLVRIENNFVSLQSKLIVL